MWICRRCCRGRATAKRAACQDFFFAMIDLLIPIFIHQPTGEDLLMGFLKAVRRLQERWLCSCANKYHHRLWSSVGTGGMVGGQMAFRVKVTQDSTDLFLGLERGKVRFCPCTWDLQAWTSKPDLKLVHSPALALPKGWRRLLQHRGGTWRYLSFPAGEVLSPACPPQIPQGS